MLKLVLDLCLLLAGTAILGIVTTRMARSLAHRLEILDRPDPRKVHRAPIAYLGGMGMILAVMGGFCLLSILRPITGAAHGQQLTAIAIGAFFIFLVGLWDDIRGMNAFVKLGMQIITGAGMWVAGLRIDQVTTGIESSLTLLQTGDPTGQLVSFILTVGWYVALLNAINLIDGLDGLAGGVAAICAASIVGIALATPGTPLTLLGGFIAAITAGATLGFLVHNWHPAKIFMGDAGSLLLGFLLASAALVSSSKASTLQAMLVPLVAMGLPLFEITFSFARRMLRGRSPFKPDRRHLHHRLMDLGLSQQRVVFVFLFATAFLGMNSVLLAQAGSLLMLLNVAFLGIGLILMIENLRFLEKKRADAVK